MRKQKCPLLRIVRTKNHGVRLIVLEKTSHPPTIVVSFKRRLWIPSRNPCLPAVGTHIRKNQGLVFNVCFVRGDFFLGQNNTFPHHRVDFSNRIGFPIDYAIVL